VNDALSKVHVGYELGIKVAFPILLGVSAWTFTQLWQHAGRLTVLEVRNEAIMADVQEIGRDVKTLLNGGR